MKYIVVPPLRIVWAIFCSLLLIIASIILLIVTFTWTLNIKTWKERGGNPFDTGFWEFRYESFWDSKEYKYTSIWHWAFSEKPIGYRYNYESTWRAYSE